jgi:hypothetical protein
VNILEALRHRRDKLTFGGFPSLHCDDMKVLGAGTNTKCAACKGKPYCQHGVLLMEINTEAVQRREDALRLESIQASKDREA